MPTTSSPCTHHTHTHHHIPCPLYAYHILTMYPSHAHTPPHPMPTVCLPHPHHVPITCTHTTTSHAHCMPTTSSPCTHHTTSHAHCMPTTSSPCTHHMHTHHHITCPLYAYHILTMYPSHIHTHTHTPHPYHVLLTLYVQLSFHHRDFQEKFDIVPQSQPNNHRGNMHTGSKHDLPTASGCAHEGAEMIPASGDKNIAHISRSTHTHTHVDNACTSWMHTSYSDPPVRNCNAYHLQICARVVRY